MLGVVGPDIIFGTVTSNAFDQGQLTSKDVGMFFEPSNSSDVVNGTLTFGGVAEGQIAGNLTVVLVPSSKSETASNLGRFI